MAQNTWMFYLIKFFLDFSFIWMQAFFFILGHQSLPASWGKTPAFEWNLYSRSQERPLHYATYTATCTHTNTQPIAAFLFSNRLWKWEIWKRPCHRDKVRTGWKQNRPFMDVSLHALPLRLGPGSIHLLNSAFRWTNSHQTRPEMSALSYVDLSTLAQVGLCNQDIIEKPTSNCCQTYRESVS